MTACCTAMGAPTRRTSRAAAIAFPRSRASRTGASRGREHASSGSVPVSSEPEGEDRTHTLSGYGRNGGTDHAEADVSYENDVENYVRYGREGHDSKRADGISLRPQERARGVEQEEADRS